MARASLAQVEFGSWVEVELIDQRGDPERLTFIIVSEEAADMDQNLLSEQAPLAKAILGRPVGSVVAYRFGEIEKVRILRARRVTELPSAEAAQRRQAMLQKAVSAAERTNAEMFAASYSGKWGDYDAAGPAGCEENPSPV
jgi:hypothetical protein